ncbi:hypothetical protein F4861DRAFT_445340 [Xylaria intraflava]|nr:hypothetical protein F4861DRAFT_445340 [Xylaria intraflava]
MLLPQVRATALFTLPPSGCLQNPFVFPSSRRVSLSLSPSHITDRLRFIKAIVFHAFCIQLSNCYQQTSSRLRLLLLLLFSSSLYNCNRDCNRVRVCICTQIALSSGEESTILAALCALYFLPLLPSAFFYYISLFYLIRRVRHFTDHHAFRFAASRPRRS